MDTEAKRDAVDAAADELYKVLIAVADAGREVAGEAMPAFGKLTGFYLVPADVLEVLRTAVKRWSEASEKALAAIAREPHGHPVECGCVVCESRRPL